MTPMPAVDWKKLRHAQGPATRIPKQIAALASGKREERERAFVLFIDQFQKAGEWFSASASTLAALLDAVDGAGAPELVLAIAAEVLASDSVLGWCSPVPKDARSAEAQATQAVASQQMARLLAWLQADPSLRAGAAFVLAFVDDGAAAAVAALSNRLWEEEDAVVRASLWLALARVGEHDATVRDAARQAPREQSAVTRGALGLARIRLEPAIDLDSLQAELLDWVSWPTVDSLRVLSMPWFLAPVAGFAELTGVTSATDAALVALAREQQRVFPIASTLVAAAREAEPGPATARAGDVVLELGGFAFDSWFVALPSELSRLERQIGELIAETEVWPMAGRGLPGAGQARQRLFGRLPPGPLDAAIHLEIGGKTATLPRWRAWFDLLMSRATPADRMPEVIASGLAPLERWQVLVEFVAETYGVSIALTASEIDAELSRVPHDDSFFELTARLADDLSRRFETARRERRRAIVRRELSALLFLPFVRAQRPIREEWDTLIFLGAGGELLLETLPPARREALVRDRIPLDGGSLAQLGLSEALAVFPFIDSPAVVEHVERALERVEQVSPIAAKRYRNRFSEAMKVRQTSEGSS